MFIDLTRIENPYAKGSCLECIYHSKASNGTHVCSEKHDGISTNVCSKIPTCNHYHRNCWAGAPESAPKKNLLQIKD